MSTAVEGEDEEAALAMGAREVGGDRTAPQFFEVMPAREKTAGDVGWVLVLLLPLFLKFCVLETRSSCRRLKDGSEPESESVSELSWLEGDAFSEGGEFGLWGEVLEGGTAFLEEVAIVLESTICGPTSSQRSLSQSDARSIRRSVFDSSVLADPTGSDLPSSFSKVSTKAPTTVL